MIAAHERLPRWRSPIGQVTVPRSRASRGSEADDPAALAQALGGERRPASEYRVDMLRADVEQDLQGLQALLRRRRRARRSTTIRSSRRSPSCCATGSGPRRRSSSPTTPTPPPGSNARSRPTRARFGDRRWVVVTGHARRQPRNAATQGPLLLPEDDDRGGRPRASRRRRREGPADRDRRPRRGPEPPAGPLHRQLRHAVEPDAARPTQRAHRPSR